MEAFFNYFGAYIILHTPAIVMLVMAFTLRREKPDTSQILFILSGGYFLIGGGLCYGLTKINL